MGRESLSPVPLDSLLPSTVSPGVLLGAGLVTAFSAAIQGTLGFGFAVVAVPFCSLLHPSLVPVPQLLLALPLTGTMAFRERHAIDLAGMGFVLGARLVGVGLGALVVGLASARVLDAFIGATVLGGALALSSRSRSPRTRPAEATFGLLSGFSGYVAAIGGPPLALLYRDESGPALRANLAAQFGLGVVLVVALRALLRQMTWLDVHLALVLVLPMFIGLAVSHHLVSRVEPRRLRASVLLLSGAAGLGLLLRAVF